MRHLEELGGDYNHVEMYHAHMYRVIALSLVNSWKLVGTLGV